jgi:hypothetical protein
MILLMIGNIFYEALSQAHNNKLYSSGDVSEI